MAIAINSAMSAALFLIVFGFNQVPARDLAIDFLPQTAGAALLGGLIPSLITFRKVTAGKVLAAGPVPSMRRQLIRVASMVIVAVISFGTVALGLTTWLAPDIVGPTAALLVKTAYGGMIGRLVAIPLVRSVLGMPMF